MDESFQQKDTDAYRKMPGRRLLTLVTALLFAHASHAARRSGGRRGGGRLAPAMLAEDSALTWRDSLQTVRVEAYGRDGVRVRVAPRRHAISNLTLGAILPEPEVLSRESAAPEPAVAAAAVVVVLDGYGGGNLTNGNLRVTVTSGADRPCCSAGAMPAIAFWRADTGEALLSEFYPLHGRAARRLSPLARGAALQRAEFSFSAAADEHYYGLGQRQHGALDQRGMVLDLDQINTEVSIPFLLSSKGYGFLWNVPARGRVELGGGANNARTRWVAEAAAQVDYLVIGTPAAPATSTSTTSTTSSSSSSVDLLGVLARYVEATGHAPPVPAYASGYWQCKLRYASQAELLNVTREFRARQLPLDVIVVDYEHWAHQGDWAFDPKFWPDPRAMLDEITGGGDKDQEGVGKKGGTEVMVSVWPSVSYGSDHFGEMAANGLLVGTEGGGGGQGVAGIMGHFDGEVTSEYDAFDADSRAFVWGALKANYFDLGVRAFWLDADEGGGLGEGDGGPPVDEVYAAGSQAQVGPLYALNNQRMLHEGLAAAGVAASVTLSRSAWAGSQRWGGAVWSGDVHSTFESLALQVTAGLNIAMSGIALWATDIGGFFSDATPPTNDIGSPYFRELVVRWFQFGAFCPLFRLHGDRSCNDTQGFVTCPNEPWSFGDEAYEHIKAVMALRQSMRPYIDAALARTTAEGRPLMRALFLDFPADAAAAPVDDQFMFGDELLVAPVLTMGQRTRTLYLPAGASWREHWTNVTRAGGATITVDAPIEQIPFFHRVSSD